MLVIRPDQVAALEADLFERWMETHLRTHFAPLCHTRTSADLLGFIRDGAAKARRYGLGERGELQRFINLMLVLGSNFDVDPATAWAGKILGEPGEASPAARLELLYHFAAEHLTYGAVRSAAFTSAVLDIADDEPDEDDTETRDDETSETQDEEDEEDAADEAEDDDEDEDEDEHIVDDDPGGAQPR
jgi:hypothetical protein